MLCLWEYTSNRRNYDGWHLTADSDGRAALRAAVEAILSGGKTQVTVPLDRPTPRILAVPGNRRSGIVTVPRVVLDASERVRICRDSDVLRLPVGRQTAPVLIHALALIEAGEGDRALEPFDPSLWVWWYPRPA